MKKYIIVITGFTGFGMMVFAKDALTLAQSMLVFFAGIVIAFISYVGWVTCTERYVLEFENSKGQKKKTKKLTIIGKWWAIVDCRRQGYEVICDTTYYI